MEGKGIKETLELLDGLKVIGVTGSKVFADGKIKLDDLPKLLELGKKFEVIKEAVLGVDQIKDEVKDLDQEEIMQLVAKILELASAMKEASKEV